MSPNLTISSVIIYLATVFLQFCHSVKISLDVTFYGGTEEDQRWLPELSRESRDGADRGASTTFVSRSARPTSASSLLMPSLPVVPPRQLSAGPAFTNSFTITSDFLVVVDGEYSCLPPLSYTPLHRYLTATLSIRRSIIGLEDYQTWLQLITLTPSVRFRVTAIRLQLPGTQLYLASTGRNPPVSVSPYRARSQASVTFSRQMPS